MRIDKNPKIDELSKKTPMESVNPKRDRKKYAKEYYKKNKEKLNERSKKYYEENKLVRNSYGKKYYKKNKIDINIKHREYIKKTNYAYSKTPKRSNDNNIRSKTKYHYPINNQKCDCGNKAQQHHHTTSPMEVDKFIFVCKRCHKDIHSNLKKCKGVFKYGKN